MITLLAFGPGCGQPDFSPFVMKAMMLLKLAGLDYTVRRADVRKAPKGKLPVLVDDGETIPDSTFIRLHIEKKYGMDFDAGLTPAERATSWAAQKLLENEVYWVGVHDRWLIDENFEKGPALFFEKVPGLVRPFITRMVRRKIAAALDAGGMGRHSRAEMAEIVGRDIGAIADLIGDRPYFMGEVPTGGDATVFPFLWAGMAKPFDTDARRLCESHRNLVAYVERMKAQYFPDFVNG